jgi:hypothetical protein
VTNPTNPITSDDKLASDIAQACAERVVEWLNDLEPDKNDDLDLTPIVAPFVASLEAEVAGYREALEPFADAADTWDAAQPTDGHPDIRVADLYAARAALSQHTDGGNNNGSK